MSKTKDWFMKTQYNEQIGADKMITQRPWGYFVVLEDKDTHKVKRIVVHGGQRLSYQSHDKRAETWVFTEGEGIVTIDEVEQKVVPKSVMNIPLKAKHRIKNTGESDLVFIEVQTGEYFGEDDIVRYNDDYGRA